MSEGIGPDHENPQIPTNHVEVSPPQKIDSQQTPAETKKDGFFSFLKRLGHNEREENRQSEANDTTDGLQDIRAVSEQTADSSELPITQSIDTQTFEPAIPSEPQASDGVLSEQPLVQTPIAAGTEMDSVVSEFSKVSSEHLVLIGKKRTDTTLPDSPSIKQTFSSGENILQSNSIAQDRVEDATIPQQLDTTIPPGTLIDR